MSDKSSVELLGIELGNLSTTSILENIKKGLKGNGKFCHIVSINPENLVIASKSAHFARVLAEAEIKINDGVGTVLASRLLYGAFVPRVTGVGLMEKMLNLCSDQSVRVLLIGGKPNLAEEMAECYNRSYPGSKFVGITGFSDIQNQTVEEQKTIDAIVADLRPQIIFVSFGSPSQELWIDKNRALLRSAICMGVGGAFDFLGGSTARAPRVLQRLGLEWLFRLILQPWRWRRQLRLFVFMWLVIRERFGYGERS